MVLLKPYLDDYGQMFGFGKKKEEVKGDVWEKYGPAVDLRSTYSTSYTPKKIQKDLI